MNGYGLDLVVAESFEDAYGEFGSMLREASASPCITPGNPYILHCFPAHGTTLTAEHRRHLDSIARLIGSSFRSSRPIRRVKIVGHSATWRGISRSTYAKRALERAGNARAALLGRLANAGLGGKVRIKIEGRADDAPLVDNMIHSSSTRARHNRALNRRVEIRWPARPTGPTPGPGERRYSPKNRKLCKVVTVKDKPLPDCTTPTGRLRADDIDVALATAANRRLSIKLGWGKLVENITQEVLMSYRYDADDPGFAVAMANWQRDNCFGTVNGILGPKEWREMKHLLHIAESLMTIDLGAKKHLRWVNTFMPRSSLGLCARKRPHHRYGIQETIDALIEIGIDWWLDHSTAPPIQIRDISLPYGTTKKWLKHNSHRIGIDVDIGLMRNDCRPRGTRITASSYSRRLTQELIDTIVENRVLKVHKIFFDDAGVTAPRGVLSCDGRHSNHMHVRFCMPSKYDLKAMRKESNTSTRASYVSCEPAA